MAVVQTGYTYTQGIVQTDSDGYKYVNGKFAVDGTPVRFYAGAGTPNGVITAPIGSEYQDGADGKVYRNLDGGTTWDEKD